MSRMKAMVDRDAKHVSDAAASTAGSYWGAHHPADGVQRSAVGGTGANQSRKSGAVHGGDSFNFFKVGTGYAGATATTTGDEAQVEDAVASFLGRTQ